MFHGCQRYFATSRMILYCCEKGPRFSGSFPKQPHTPQAGHEEHEVPRRNCWSNVLREFPEKRRTSSGDTRDTKKCRDSVIKCLIENKQLKPKKV